MIFSTKKRAQNPIKAQKRGPVRREDAVEVAVARCSRWAWYCRGRRGARRLDDGAAALLLLLLFVVVVVVVVA